MDCGHKVNTKMETKKARQMPPFSIAYVPWRCEKYRADGPNTLNSAMIFYHNRLSSLSHESKLIIPSDCLDQVFYSSN